MNTPNKLTLIRILLVLPLAVVLLTDIPYKYLISMIIFIAASITDAVDGSMARKKNLVTNFGKFLDPLADKILICTVLVCFVELDLIKAAAVIIIIIREFLITAVRLIAVEKGKVIAAAFWGKIKTISQITAIITIFVICTATEEIPFVKDVLKNINLRIAGDILIWIAVAFTVISGIEYLINNRKIILDQK